MTKPFNHLAGFAFLVKDYPFPNNRLLGFDRDAHLLFGKSYDHILKLSEEYYGNNNLILEIKQARRN